MKRIMCALLFTSLTSWLLGQNIDDIPTDLLNKANTAKDVNYLTESEKNVILFMNLARIDGAWFIKNVLEKTNSEAYSETNFNSLKKDLNELPSLEPYKPAKGLSMAAAYHAEDMGKTGKTGHKSSDGTATFVRVHKYAKGGYMAENCSYGYDDPLKIVLQLLVDDGVASLGHRMSIISPNYTHVGVSIKEHSVYSYNCVQDFSDTGD